MHAQSLTECLKRPKPGPTGPAPDKTVPGNDNALSDCALEAVTGGYIGETEKNLHR